MSKERISLNSSSDVLTDTELSASRLDARNPAERTAVEVLVLLSDARQMQELFIQQALAKEDAPLEALVYLENALKINPACSRAWLYSAMCYETLGNFTQAIKCYDHIPEDHCMSMPVPILRQRAERTLVEHNNLLQQSEAFIQRRQFKEAKDAFENILDTSSVHPHVLRRLEDVEEMQRKDLEDSQRFFRSSRQLRVQSVAKIEIATRKRDREGGISADNKIRQLPDRACKNRK